MASGFEFSRDFEEQILRAAEPGLKEIAGKIQKVLDSMSARYKGQPLDDIKPVLKRELAQFDDAMPDAELAKYAVAISEGTPIRTRVGKER
ncbi:MAG TPA: hypothetical protein VMB04_12480 [Mycobacterium sp.]|nr:hypothetical protein [Mycobacterium sp.]